MKSHGGRRHVYVLFFIAAGRSLSVSPHLLLNRVGHPADVGHNPRPLKAPKKGQTSTQRTCDSEKHLAVASCFLLSGIGFQLYNYPNWLTLKDDTRDNITV